MSVEVQEIERRLVSLPDEELLGVVTTHAGEYREVARHIAAQELARRGVGFTPPPEKPAWFPDAQPPLAPSADRWRWDDFGFKEWAVALQVVVLVIWGGIKITVYLQDKAKNDHLLGLVHLLWLGVLFFGAGRLEKWREARSRRANPPTRPKRNSP